MPHPADDGRATNARQGVDIENSDPMRMPPKAAAYEAARARTTVSPSAARALAGQARGRSARTGHGVFGTQWYSVRVPDASVVWVTAPKCRSSAACTASPE